MKQGDRFYKVEVLVSKTELDCMNEKIGHKPTIIFEAIQNAGVKVYEVRVTSASARIHPEYIAIDEAGQSEISTRNGFDRHKVEKPITTPKGAIG